MSASFPGGPARPGRGRRRGRVAVGCLLLIAGVIVLLIILSLLFGGFQKGTKVGGSGLGTPLRVTADR